MSTLEHEQALIFDRDLQRKTSGLNAKSSAESWVKAANALSLRSLHYLARELTEKGLAFHPGETGLWMVLIQASAMSSERLQTCFNAISNAEAEIPGREVLFALIDYYLERDKRGLARLKKIPEDRKDATYFEVCGYYAMAGQEYKQAVRHFKEAHRKAPKELRLVYHLGKSYYSAGNIEEAVRWLYRAVAKERHFVQAWNTLCRIHLEEGNLGLARQTLGMALAVNPRDWGLYFNYADHYMANGRYFMAMYVLQEVLDMQPRDVIAAEVHNYRGYLYYLDKDYSKALPSFEKALSLNPSLAVAWLNIGNIHFHRKKMEDARKAYKMAMKKDPNLSPAYCQTGLSYLEQGEPAKAAMPLERAIALDPSDYWAHLGLSEYYRKTKNPIAALEEARQALRIAPDDPNVYNYLGIALETNRLYFKAEKAYGKALELDPGQRWAANNLGYLCEKIMRMNPDYKSAAIEAWKTRLLICRNSGTSVRGAINHLEKLGVSTKSIRGWLDQAGRGKKE